MTDSFLGQQNVLGLTLAACCINPVTGFFRDAFCRTHTNDIGMHTVCAHITDEFLQFTLSRGNDLITPQRQWGFAGLKDGDRWCLCASRWKEACEAGVAPPIYIHATHIKTLEVIELTVLKRYALDLTGSV